MLHPNAEELLTILTRSKRQFDELFSVLKILDPNKCASVYKILGDSLKTEIAFFEDHLNQLQNLESLTQEQANDLNVYRQYFESMAFYK